MRKPTQHPKPGTLLKCKRENHLYCKENLSPYMFDGCLIMPEIGEVVMYLDRKTYQRKTYYKVLYIDTIYYIRGDAFKDETRKTNSSKT